MDKSKGFSSIFIPAGTVFLASACVMAIELVAGRLIATKFRLVAIHMDGGNRGCADRDNDWLLHRWTHRGPV